MGSPNVMVYIVDDDPTVCDALSSLLRANGKNVRALSSGADFLSFERSDAGACLILDLRMPGVDGLEVQKLISNQASIPVIFITGRATFPPL
jgi:FixJ family two-component response regulator